MAVKNNVDKVFMVTCDNCVCTYPIYGVTRKNALGTALMNQGWTTPNNDRLWYCESCSYRSEK